jgi:uncharacterized membrane protein YgaE (UPF0421/DUF939 family)
MAAGGTVAWWLAVELGARRPIFAALVPLVAMAGDPFAAVFVTLGRIVGVFAGVGIGIAFIHVGLPSTARVALVLLCGAAGSVLLRVGGRPNLEVPIAGLFMLGVGTAIAGRFGVQRIWETGIGGAVAIAVSAFVWPPDPVRELRRQLERLRRDLVDDLARIAADLALGTGETAEQLDAVRAHSRDAVRDVFDLDSARRALRWSPLRRGDIPEVDDLEQRINLAARVYRHTRSLARDITDVPQVDDRLAAVTRDLADATDRMLTGGNAEDPLARAEATLAGAGSVVGVQLRQLLADLRSFDG